MAEICLLSPPPPPSGESEPLNRSYNSFSEALILTASNCFQKTKETVTPKFSTPWWNTDCHDAVRHRRHCKNIFHRHPTAQNLAHLHSAESLTRQVIKKAKRKSLVEFSNTLNRETSVKQTWDYLSKFARKRPSTPCYPIILEDQILTNPISKANAIAEYYSAIFNSISHSLNDNSLLVPIALAMSDDSTTSYNSPFLPHELDSVLDNLKASSPGQDNIHNLMLKNLPSNYRQWALQLINDSFNSSHIPNSWKQALILPILKPNKSPLQTSSYRPIALLSCFGKVVEKIICKRLTYVLEKNIALSSTQGGFRKRLSTHEQLARLENSIRHSLYNREHCIALFFDLSHAYDGVWHLGLLSRLAQCGIHGKMLRWLREFLTGRTYNVYYEGETSRSHSIKSGVPQGSILSPILFNVMLSGIPHSTGIHMSEYADDILVYCSGPSIDELSTLLQNHVNLLTTWFSQWGFTLNESKTRGLVFSLRQPATPSITVGNSLIPFVREYKYLGMILDAPKLRWTPHIAHIQTITLRRQSIMKALSHKHWGADRTVLTRIYKGFIRSTLDYGSIFYMSASQTTLAKLDIIQNSCLRIIVGAMKSSPIISLEVESNIPPLSIHRDYVLLRYYFRFVSLPTDIPLLNDLIRMNQSSYFNGWTSVIRSAPLLVRCWRILMRIQFPFGELSPAPLLSPIPPWLNLPSYIKPEFTNDPASYLTPAQCKHFFNDLANSTYCSYIPIYTDGSVLLNQAPSTAAAVIAYEHGFSMRQTFHLPSGMSIYTAELFAIHEALIYVRDNITNCPGVVIYSDSQSSIRSILNTTNPNHVYYVYKIQSLIISLLPRFPVHIQFIPAHKGIPGNELVDDLAKTGHTLPETTEAPLSQLDKLRLTHVKMYQVWESQWKSIIASSGKGRHLSLIKTVPSEWSWACHSDRKIETSLARLRLGHVGLKYHLHKINASPSPLCYCGQDETIDHFFFQCPHHAQARKIFYDSLQELNVNFSLKDILGGGHYPPDKQKLLIHSTVTFLRSTNKLSTL